MRLRELRLKEGFTQTELGRITGIPAKRYNKYENEINEPDIQTLITLANFFHITIDYIVGRDTDMVNLNGIDEQKAEIIKNVLKMDNAERDLTKAYIDGLMRKNNKNCR